jgi:hypothetical protein
MVKTENIMPIEVIEGKIMYVRNQKVILDYNLAKLYRVPTGVFLQSVVRNIRRFPDDFMFRLNEEEVNSLRSQIVISKRGGRRYLPYVFTEQGVAMLSGVLRSERAISVNIEIMRTFVRLREILSSHKELARKIEQMEKQYDAQFKIVFDAIRQLMNVPGKSKKRIGFTVDEPTFRYVANRKKHI